MKRSIIQKLNTLVQMVFGWRVYIPWLFPLPFDDDDEQMWDE